MFTVGSLLGSKKLKVLPLAFDQTGKRSLYLIFDDGAGLADYPNMICSGPMATIMDEGMAGCASAALPERVAVTLG